MRNVGNWQKGRRAMLLLVVSGAMILGCGDDEPSALAPTTSTPDAVAAPDDQADPADPADPVVVATDATAATDPTAEDGENAASDEASGGDASQAADLDAEPLQSDSTGDVPAGPPAPGDTTAGDADGSTVPGGDDDGDDPAGQQPDGQASDPQPGDQDPDDGATDPSDPATPPGPTIDTDTSPDDGDVPNGVSGDSDVRENLSYPSGPVIALGRGATTQLATELAGSDQPTLLWFWSPDCPTCVPESSSVARFVDTYQGSIRVLGVGAGGSRADADAFAAAAAIDASLLVWESGSVSHDHYNVTATPFAIMVAPNGVVMAQWRGMVPELFAFADRL
ncbi:MAG: hypothetical protein AAFO29_02590 [Actinomycetota bacterium]